MPSTESTPPAPPALVISVVALSILQRYVAPCIVATEAEYVFPAVAFAGAVTLNAFRGAGTTVAPAALPGPVVTVAFVSWQLRVRLVKESTLALLRGSVTGC